MKLSATIWIILFVLNSSFVYSQSDDMPGYRIKVKTGTGKFSGRLTGVLDSSIEVAGKGLNNKKTFPVSDIQLIKVRKTLFKNVGLDIMLGAVAGGIVVVAYYVKHSFHTPGDPPFGRALWTTMAVGASAGLIYGGIESTFVRIRIPIHNAQSIFENKRDKLSKYITY